MRELHRLLPDCDSPCLPVYGGTCYFSCEFYFILIFKECTVTGEISQSAGKYEKEAVGKLHGGGVTSTAPTRCGKHSPHDGSARPPELRALPVHLLSLSPLCEGTVSTSQDKRTGPGSQVPARPPRPAVGPRAGSTSELKVPGRTLASIFSAFFPKSFYCSKIHVEFPHLTLSTRTVLWREGHPVAVHTARPGISTAPVPRG